MAHSVSIRHSQQFQRAIVQSDGSNNGHAVDQSGRLQLPTASLTFTLVKNSLQGGGSNSNDPGSGGNRYKSGNNVIYNANGSGGVKNKSSAMAGNAGQRHAKETLSTAAKTVYMPVDSLQLPQLSISRYDPLQQTSLVLSNSSGDHPRAAASMKSSVARLPRLPGRNALGSNRTSRQQQPQQAMRRQNTAATVSSSNENELPGSGGLERSLNDRLAELTEDLDDDVHQATEDIQQSEFPMSPADAVRLLGNRLTNFEQSEIADYPDVWFLGGSGKIDAVRGSSQNHGYDDEHGSYIKVMGDHLAYRYEMIELLGKGSFGQVVRAFDHKTRQDVAIKIIRNKKRFHQQSRVEVRILEALKSKDRDEQYNVIHLRDHFYFRNHLCIVFELMGVNLYELIKKNRYQGFGMLVVKRLVGAIVECLRLLYHERIIHCDLKPENILVREQNQNMIKVIDFGSSCYEDERVYTYIQSRFYRAPEIILGLPYSTAIDMWSLGCIVAELHTGYPLFPGENESEQLACIMEVCGLPPNEILHVATRKQLFFDSRGAPKCTTNSKGRTRRPGSRELSRVVKSSDTVFIDFIRRCLEWNPVMRMTPDEAFQHEFLREIRYQRPKVTSRGVRAVTSNRNSHSILSTAVSVDYVDLDSSSEANLSSANANMADVSTNVSTATVRGAMTTEFECKTVGAPGTNNSTAADSGISSGFLPSIKN